ncbi:MAG: glucose-6-phosphate dehydrogenase [Xanthobacteraceae bacterium]|nr:glucose-6-phosphate dehydrogenase [Xanthobacteraceae bacterium]
MSDLAQTSCATSSSASVPDCTLVVFGITGDLAHRLLMPALYNLACWKLLPARFSVVGVGRSPTTAGELRKSLTESIRRFVGDKSAEFAADTLRETDWDKVVSRLDYVRGDVDDPATYEALAQRLQSQTDTSPNVLFYLAVSARLFTPVAERLAHAGLLRESSNAWRRLIIEKPFGRDVASAIALNQKLLSLMNENQIYRIDHFLGKETVQNILAFRFGNGLFEPLWSRERIDHVQITVAETVGVEKRGPFYDTTGALRDMVPNHLFQLFTMTAMEPPMSFDADSIRNKKQEVLMAVRQLSQEQAANSAVRAQYTAGCIQGKRIRNYNAEPNVDPRSRTETYVALRLELDNWRWAGVPFYLRTGKALARRCTEIAIRFKQAPLALFRGMGVETCIPNWLVLRIQPDEGISLQFGAKVPGTSMQLAPVKMEFLYKDYFRAQPSTGYETLIYDAMIGDATLFQRADNIEAGWRVVQPVLDAWASDLAPMTAYASGSDGPTEAEQLLACDGRHWRPLSTANEACL